MQKQAIIFQFSSFPKPFQNILANYQLVFQFSPPFNRGKLEDWRQLDN